MRIQSCIYMPGSTSIIDAIHPETGEPLYGSKPLAETLAEHPGAVVIPLDEASTEIDRINRAKYCTGPEEITAERFDEMLNVLPPGGYGSVRGALLFYVIEALTGDLHHWYCQIGNRYFTICESRFADRESIAGRCAELAGRSS